MKTHASIVFAWLLLIVTQPVSAVDNEAVVLFTYPPAPSSAATINLYVRRVVAPNARPLVRAVFVNSVSHLDRPGQRFSPAPGDTYEAGATFLVTIGPLATGRYLASYFEGDNFDAIETQLEFEVTTDGLATVVEYFNPVLKHYFITADADEIQKLDAGTIVGWLRTGQTFKALPGNALASNALPVCRFYGRPEAGLSSHFFSEDSQECEIVKQRWPDQWTLETDRAFGVESVWPHYDLSCDTYHQRLYRLYNNQPDPNHRYTTSPSIRDTMIASGWVLEARWFVEGGAFTSCVPI